jgi:hypothetical protein
MSCFFVMIVVLLMTVMPKKSITTMMSVMFLKTFGHRYPWGMQHILWMTCFITHFATGRARRGWQSSWAGRGRGDWNCPILLPILPQGALGGLRSLRAREKKIGLGGSVLRSSQVWSGTGDTKATQRSQPNHAYLSPIDCLVSDRFSI